MYHNRSLESLSVLARLDDRNQEDKFVQEKFRHIEASVSYEKSVKVHGFAQLFKNDGRSTRRRLAIACSVQFFQQLGGINGRFLSPCVHASPGKFGSESCYFWNCLTLSRPRKASFTTQSSYFRIPWASRQEWLVLCLGSSSHGSLSLRSFHGELYA